MEKLASNMVSKNRRLSGAAARTGDFKKIRVNNV